MEKKKNIGIIHSIETCGMVDGPGLRFVVFMQGCALRCKYCHNADTWEVNGGKEITTNELLEKIKRYKNYILTSGGVTFTGGEPLLQQDFLIEMCKLLKEENIHIAIDTSGMFEINDKIQQIIELADLFLVDIKHIDSKKCKEITGYGNEKEIAFIDYLNKINKPIWLRYVLVPGITDDYNDLKKLGEYIKSLNNVKNVEILPYHNKGMYKWGRLNRKYELDNVVEATEEDVKKAKEILNLT